MKSKIKWFSFVCLFVFFSMIFGAAAVVFMKNSTDNLTITVLTFFGMMGAIILADFISKLMEEYINEKTKR